MCATTASSRPRSWSPSCATTWRPAGAAKAASRCCAAHAAAPAAALQPPLFRRRLALDHLCARMAGRACAVGRHGRVACAARAAAPALCPRRLGAADAGPAHRFPAPSGARLRQRLQVRFEQEDNPVVDEELFQLDGLTEYLLVQQLQQQVAAGLSEPGQAPQAMEDSVRAAVARLTRSGRLPLAGLGERGARALQSSVTPSLRAWRQQLDRYAHPAPRRRLLIEDDGLVFDDWIDGLRQSCETEESPMRTTHSAGCCWIRATCSMPRAGPMPTSSCRSTCAAWCWPPAARRPSCAWWRATAWCRSCP